MLYTICLLAATLAAISSDNQANQQVQVSINRRLLGSDEKDSRSSGEWNKYSKSKSGNGLSSINLKSIFFFDSLITGHGDKGGPGDKKAGGKGRGYGWDKSNDKSKSKSDSRGHGWDKSKSKSVNKYGYYNDKNDYYYSKGLYRS
eukprot:87498_1